MYAEHNPLFKRWRKGDKRVALVYPSSYASGIANIGLQQIYAEVNSTEGFVCERFYRDVFDCTRSVETGTHIKDFDIILFSVQFEEDYFRIAKMLSTLENTKAVRVAGGPCVIENPLPLTPYFDYFYMGEADCDVERLLEVVVSDTEDENILKSETVLELSNSECKVNVRKARLESHLTEQIVGEGVYGECYLIEVGRGCRRSCSFCVVRQIYSPCRWRDRKTIVEVGRRAKNICKKVALISPSVTDHPEAKEFMWELVNMGLEVSPSSMRVDTIDQEMAELLVACGQKSVTIAPEAGSERMRRVLRKGISEEDIFEAVNCIKGKIDNVKMYYMIGLPGESDEDIDAILRLTEKVKKSGFRVSVSVNPLVPKPHTPLQFAPFGGVFEGKHGKNALNSIKELKRKTRLLEKGFRKLGVKANVEKPEDFAVQTILSRGDAEVGKALLYGKSRLLRNFRNMLGEVSFDRLPWEFINHGYSSSRIRREYERLLEIALKTVAV